MDMNKIMRLASANIRRHKNEVILLGILIMSCMALLSGAFSAEKNIKRMFPEMAERTGFLQNCISLKEDQYDERMLTLFREDERVTKCETIRYLYATSARIPDKNGKEILYPCTFITSEYEEKYENYSPQSTLSDEDIAAAEHPVYVPLNVKKTLNVKEGDIFSLIDGSKRFSFTVVGFYESGWFYDTKFVISDADYSVLKNVFDRCNDIMLSLKADADIEDVCNDWAEAGAEIGLDTENYVIKTFNDQKMEFNIEIMYVLLITKIMAVIILIAIIVMIGFRVISDIQEQIVQIGILEALGYRSREIALSYAAEYFLIALAGCIIGAILGSGVFRVLIHISEEMKGYPVSHFIHPFPVIAVLAGILLVVTLLALFKAGSVRRYPPVTAFRKGIQNHHFGKSHFPLRNTKNSIHLRLSLKRSAAHLRRNISLSFVTGITVSAVVLSFILYSFLGDSMNVLYNCAGYEMSDAEIAVMPETDEDEFCKELEALPEIRKVLPTCEMGSIMADAYELKSKKFINVYKDYSKTENIHPIAGRFPEHDNEIMITKSVSSFDHLDIGDTMRLEYKSVRRDYIITGIVTALVNGNSVYMTEDGLKLMDPLYRPTAFLIYSSEGVTTSELKTLLDSRFGKSAEELGLTNSDDQNSYEERVRAKADQIISAMLEQTGSTHVEYSIRYGDTVINGNSSGIKIKSFLNITELIESYLKTMSLAVSITTKVFMAVAAVVVMTILTILMSSEIRRQRKELGIMKSMGYTSKELMLQLAFQIMPAIIAAVAVGTLFSIIVVKILIGMIGVIPINIPAVLILDAVIIAFCFGCAYFNARKIKDISVYELMTE